MAWTPVVAVVLGLLIGLRFKVWALLAATVAVAVWALASAVAGGRTATGAILDVLLASGALQLSYLVVVLLRRHLAAGRERPPGA